MNNDLELRSVYADGRPAGGCRYVVTLPDGSTREGRLDAEGYARLGGVPADTTVQVRYLLDDPQPLRSLVRVKPAEDFAELTKYGDSGLDDASWIVTKVMYTQETAANE